MHCICVFLSFCARDTGFFSWNGVSLRGAWSSAIIHVRDTCFSVKDGVSLHSICTSPSFCVRDTGFFSWNGVSLHNICLFPAFGALDTGFSSRKGVSLHGAWSSAIIHVCDTCFLVKNGVSLHRICVFQLLSATIHGFVAEMVCRWRCVGEGVMVRRIKDKWWMVNDAGRRMKNEEWWMMKGCIELYGWGWKKGLETRG